MDEIMMATAVIGMLAIRGAAILALVYVGARLAIRHERQSAGRAL